MNSLSNTFNNLLIQYKDTNKEFMDTINSDDTSFQTIQDTAFNGETVLNTISNSTINNCMASCSSNKLCSGATFDDNSNSCNLSSGKGTIIKSSNQSAIVKQALYYSYQLQIINDSLFNINKQMMQLSSKNVDNYQQTNQTNVDNSNILQNNYNTLEQERMQIAELIKEYETLDIAYDNSTINTTSNYYYYIMYLLIAVVIGLLFIHLSADSSNQLGGGRVKSFSYIQLFIILLTVVVLFINNSIKSKSILL